MPVNQKPVGVFGSRIFRIGVEDATWFKKSVTDLGLDLSGKISKSGDIIRVSVVGRKVDLAQLQFRVDCRDTLNLEQS